MQLDVVNRRLREREQSSSPARDAKRKFRVVIVDEHPICRKGLRDLLEEDKRFQIVAELERVKASAKSIFEHGSDVAVLNVGPRSSANLEVLALLKAKKCRANFVILAHQPERDLFEHALSAGVRGFVLKQGPLNEILDCVAAVASGTAYVTPLLTDFLLNRDAMVQLGERQQPGIKHLTLTQRRILKLIAYGKTSREIAAECRISPRTVGSHRTHMCQKLGIRGANCLLHFAVEHGDLLRQLA